jgi:hypothetical protein
MKTLISISALILLTVALAQAFEADARRTGIEAIKSTAESITLQTRSLSAVQYQKVATDTGKIYLQARYSYFATMNQVGAQIEALSKLDARSAEYKTLQTAIYKNLDYANSVRYWALQIQHNLIKYAPKIPAVKDPKPNAPNARNLPSFTPDDRGQRHKYLSQAISLVLASGFTRPGTNTTKFHIEQRRNKLSQALRAVVNDLKISQGRQRLSPPGGTLQPAGQPIDM